MPPPDTIATAIADVQTGVPQRLLRVFLRRSLLPGDDAQAMGQWEHGGGFSLDASVRIAAADRAGCERLLHHCARPPFAQDRLREFDSLAALVPSPHIRRHRCASALPRTAAMRDVGVHRER